MNWLYLAKRSFQCMFVTIETILKVNGCLIDGGKIKMGPKGIGVNGLNWIRMEACLKLRGRDVYLLQYSVL